MLKKLSVENLRTIRNKKITRFVQGNILELGCGTGWIPTYLRKNGFNNKYTGVDIHAKTVARLSKEFVNYNFIHRDLNELLDFKTEKFDVTIASAVIEHIYNQKNFILTATKNLNVGGKLILTTPTVFGNDIIYPLICKLGMRGGKGILSDHITIYNKDRLNVIANDFGLKIEYFEFFEFFCNQLIVFKKL